MKKKHIIALNVLREFSLASFLLMSLAMCYMIGECISFLVQYFLGYDYVLAQHDYEMYYIYPNLLLLLVLFFVIRQGDKGVIGYILLLQFFFIIKDV